MYEYLPGSHGGTGTVFTFLLVFSYNKSVVRTHPKLVCSIQHQSLPPGFLKLKYSFAAERQNIACILIGQTSIS
jgi:hypothetical protein